MTGDESNSLLKPVPDGGNWRGNAAIGGWREDDSALAAGFLQAADALVEHWKAHRPKNLLAVPIFYNYRHAIELALKHVIRDAAACIRRDGMVDAELSPDELNRRLAKTHAIGTLRDELNRRLRLLDVESENQQLDPETQEVLDSLHVLDESGQAFRYPVVRTGRGTYVKFMRARPHQQHVDLAATAAALHDACQVVLGGVSCLLEEHRQGQQEMREEYGAY